MNNLIIDNHVIKKDIREILTELKKCCVPGKLKDIVYQGDNVRISCPVHKDGMENKPSCNIYIGDDEKTCWGTAHCFSCGYKGSLATFISEACDRSLSWANNWLKDNFTDYVLDENKLEIDEPIAINKPKKSIKKQITDDSLFAFQSWHPYLEKRGLSKKICEKYDVCYDQNSECIVFPVRNLSGRISFMTRRSVNSKKFIIDKDIDKDVYLLYNIIKDKVKAVYVCESQINALTLESWGYRAIALLGTGTEHQYELLDKSGIVQYYLCFDGDEAGKKGIDKFAKNVYNGFVTVVEIPKGKDVNDLTKDQFEKLNRKDLIY